jgi:hypothetical protein
MGQIDYHGHTIAWTTQLIAPGRFAVMLITDGHNHGIQAFGHDRKTVWRKGRRIAERYWRDVVQRLVITEALARKAAPRPREHVTPLKPWTPTQRTRNAAILVKIALTVHGV